MATQKNQQPKRYKAEILLDKYPGSEVFSYPSFEYPYNKNSKEGKQYLKETDSKTLRKKYCFWVKGPLIIKKKSTNFQKQKKDQEGNLPKF